MFCRSPHYSTQVAWGLVGDSFLVGQTYVPGVGSSSQQSWALSSANATPVRACMVDPILQKPCSVPVCLVEPFRHLGWVRLGAFLFLAAICPNVVSSMLDVMGLAVSGRRPFGWFFGLRLV